MSSSTAITASYRAEVSLDKTNANPAAGGPLTFEASVDTSNRFDASPSPKETKAGYLKALSIALATLQESINSGLTERLVQQGVLSETTDKDPNVNTKLRTKIPGQPNNSKKGQTKKQQQQREECEGNTNELTNQPEYSSTGTATSSAPAVGISPLSSSTIANIATTTTAEPLAASDVEMQNSDQYRPKGGIYGDEGDEADSQDKDEIDLVMEADPGEEDGACLELPKDQARESQQNKKRNELPIDNASDLATTKKPKGSEDD
ncbi:hypothetical protein EDD11_003727 [Mortierella claussenii]|nr:hypothetical protein EDD11_003727 [Mortierella claussenii]